MQDRIERLLRNALGELRARLPKLSMARNMGRPFTPADLRPVPSGWRTGPPDFVGVASGSAGSSWWYKLMLSHPQVQPNRLGMKELYYFFHFRYSIPSSASFNAYRQAFAAPEGSICGEWSPGYLRHPFAIQHLATVAPDARLIVILRNPVDRFISTWNRLLNSHAKYLALRGKRRYINNQYALFPLAMANCQMAMSIRRMFDFYPPARVLVLQYEQCKREPEAQYARTCRFLGIDDSFRPPAPTRSVNAKRHRVTSLTAEERRHLADYFKYDVLECSSLVPDLDLSLWKDFSGFL